MLEEGLEKVQERHRNAAAVLKEGLESRKVVYAVKDSQVCHFFLLYILSFLRTDFLICTVYILQKMWMKLN